MSCPPVATSGAGGEGDPGLLWVAVAALAASGCEIAAGGDGGLLARQRLGWPPWAGGRWPWPSLQLAPLLKLPMVGPAAALELPGWMSRSLSR